MSLTPLFLEGFEEYGSAANVGYTGATLVGLTSLTVGTSYGRFGGIGLSQAGGALSFTLPSATFVAGISAAIYRVSGTSSQTLFTLRDAAGTAQGSVTANGDGSVSVLRGSTVLGTTAATGYFLPTSAYRHIEVQCKVDPTVGTWDVWIDGVNVLSLSALNTRGSTVVGSGVSSVLIGATAFSIYSDDIVVYDAAARTGATGGTFEHYGDKRVQTLFPSGAGTGDVNPGNWVQTGGTGGSPWTAVNERGADTTSYLADATAGDIKSFALDDLAAGTTGVSAIAMTACWEKDDATTRSCAVGVRNSSTNAFGTTRAAPSSYAYTQDIRTTDTTGAALTPTNVNAMELLFKVVS